MSQGIEFGVAVPDIENTAVFAKNAEDLGYDYVTVGEHVSFNVPVPNSLISLAVAAGATERIKLMSSIVLLPLYPAALAAKQAMILDVASGGRYHFGVGVGGEIPREFEACGVPLKERGPRTNEALEVITRLFTEDSVTFKGRFNTLNDVNMEPKSIQKPHPPIWVAGRQDVAMKRTAKYANGWLPYMYTPEQLSDSLTKIKEMRAEFGREDELFIPGLFIFVCAHEDRATARDMCAKRLSKQYAQDFSGLIDKYALVGTPDDCAARLQEYVDAGATTVMLSEAGPKGYIETNYELVAKELVPKFK